MHQLLPDLIPVSSQRVENQITRKVTILRRFYIYINMYPQGLLMTILDLTNTL